MKPFWKRVTDGAAVARRSWTGAIAGLTAAVGLGGVWSAIHAFPGFGPACADAARALVGPGPVAQAEDFVYGVEDRIKGLVYSDAPPKTFWDPPAGPPDDPPPAQLPIASMEPVAPTFLPAPFEPPVSAVAAPTDGQWIAVADPGAPRDPARMYKTTVHPDGRRRYAAVAVIAIDLERVDLRLVAGTLEPASAEVPPSARPGVVPAARCGDLMAAFNGGFKVMHGHYGMMLDGRTFLPPRETSCTVALYDDGSIRIRTWSALAEGQGGTEGAARMTGYRQTPPCLVEEGRISDPLVAGETHGWGAAVGGETAIRRSAVGLDATGRRLLYAIGESVTAGTLARAMKAAGAEDAAQLDVNAAYPRFVFYGHARPGELPMATGALIPDIAFARHEYVGRPEGRDFFYLTRKSP